MKRFQVKFRAEARNDLIRLPDYISDRSGDAIASAYVDRIEAICAGLANSPHRGTLLPIIEGGIRRIGFERRAAIYFRVVGPTVEIVRILYGGRDQDRAFGAASNADDFDPKE